MSDVEHTSQKKRKILLIAGIAAAVLLAVLTAAWFGFYLPYSKAESSMPQGILTLVYEEDGSARLEWPAGVDAENYLVTLQRVGDPSPWYCEKIAGSVCCTLQSVPSGTMRITIHSIAGYRTWFGEKERQGETALEVTADVMPPSLRNLTWEIDQDADLFTASYQLSEGQVCCVSVPTAEGFWESQFTEERAEISFGPEQDLPMPTYKEACSITFRSYVSVPGLTIHGAAQTSASVAREDLLGTQLQLELTDEGHNRYTLSWNETKGERYELQRFDNSSKNWKTLLSVSRDGERVYDTGHLERYCDYRFRVIAVGGQTLLPDSDYAATPDEVSVTTGASLIYSTVWPIQDLDIYSDAEKSEVLGTAPKATAYCVLDEENGLFRVRYGEDCGYIDGNYCLINLPEYLGDLCAYDIVNSYEALYMVHDYAITDITGEVVKGYERIKLGRDSYLVPLLYPVAQRLEKAAMIAQDQGYRLKIYDSFRPGLASEEVRAACVKILEELIPPSTFSGEPAKDMPDVPIQGTESDPNLSGGMDSEGGETEPVEYLTYQYLMTDNGRMPLNNFIAGFGSRHNYGVALDLTLERLGSREEVEMQAAIHDLSHYSELSKNNRSANILSSIMLNAGFGGLNSEWWHFQDNEVFNNLKPEKLWDAVTPECWMADDSGWRYRQANGSYYTNCTVQLGNASYTFDHRGYVVTSENEGS